MSIILAIALKNLKYIWRNLKSLSIVFILPIAFMCIFAVIFNQRPTDITFSIGVTGSEQPELAKFAAGLDKIKNGKGENRFRQTAFSSDNELRKAIQERKVAAGLSLQNSQIQLLTDPANINGSAIIGTMRDYADSYYNTPNQKIVVVPITIEQSQNASGFTYLVPGLIVYGLLSLLPQITLNLSDEARKQKTFRYFTAKVSGFQIIAGYLLSQTALGLIETTLLLITALLLGYQTSVQNILGAFLIATLTNFFVIGSGLLIGGLSKNAQSASNLGSMIAIILGFLSGAFVQFPEIKLFDQITLTSLVPSYHATEALRKVLQFSRPLSETTTELSIIAISSLIIFVIGGYLYEQNQLRNLS
jgi:ABC-type multidrug transport system permease subunit